MKEAKKILPYTRKEINPTFSDENRFWNKVDKTGGPDGCWPWVAHKFDKGYGCFFLKGQVLRAHRVAWVLIHGQIPRSSSYHGICVCHRCDVPACCNPAHLFLGTNADNVADREKKHRNTPGEANTSAKLTNANVAKILSDYAVGDVSHEELASRFGVSPNTIGCVINRKSWKHLPFDTVKPIRIVKKAKPICGEANASSKLKGPQVIRIRSAYKAGATLKHLASFYGVHISTIWEIIHRKSWKHVLDPSDPLSGIW